MDIVCSLDNSLGTIGVSPSEAADALDALDAFLVQPDLKAVIVTANGNIDPSEIGQLQGRLRAAAVPTAAVLSSSSDTADRVAEACHFTFSSAKEAKAHLRSLTDRRPAHVVRAVITSISNGRHMPLEEALLEETRLFSELSAKKQSGPREGGP